MPSRTVRYFRRVSRREYEPLATCKAGLRIELEARGLMWCPECKAAVSPLWDPKAVYEADVCPFGHSCSLLTAEEV